VKNKETIKLIVVKTTSRINI